MSLLSLYLNRGRSGISLGFKGVLLALIPIGLLSSLLQWQIFDDYHAVDPQIMVKIFDPITPSDIEVLKAARWQQYEDLYYNTLIYQQNYWQKKGFKDKHLHASMPGVLGKNESKRELGFEAPWQEKNSLFADKNLYETFAHRIMADHNILISAIDLVIYATPRTVSGTLQTKEGEKAAKVLPIAVKNSKRYQQLLKRIEENLDNASPPIALAFYRTEEVINHLISGYAQQHWFSYAVILGGDAQSKDSVREMQNRSLLLKKKIYLKQQQALWVAAMIRAQENS